MKIEWRKTTGSEKLLLAAIAVLIAIVLFQLKWLSQAYNNEQHANDRAFQLYRQSLGKR